MKKVPLSAEVVGQILYSSADATIVTDEKGVICLINQSALDLFGYEADELMGQPVEILMPPEHRDRHRGLRGAYNSAPRARPMISGLEIS